MSYAKIFRGLNAHWLAEDRPFNGYAAWVWLVLNAAWREHATFTGKVQRRGEVLTSQIKLGEAWGWDRKKVRNFLRRLRADSMIQFAAVAGEKGLTSIVIANYEQYQTNGEFDENSPRHVNGESASGPKTPHQTPHPNPIGASGEISPLNSPLVSPFAPHQFPITKKDKKEKNPAHAAATPLPLNGGQVISAFIDAYRAQRGAGYTLTGRDKTAARELAAIVPPDGLPDVLQTYLADDDAWIVRQGHSLTALTSRARGYLTTTANGNGAAVFMQRRPSDLTPEQQQALFSGDQA